MASNVFRIKRGSCIPQAEIQIVKASGVALDLTGGSAFRLVAAESFQTETAALIIDKTLTVVDLATGRLLADWADGDTDVPEAKYKTEVRFVKGGKLCVVGIDYAIKIEGSVEEIP
jgi:hypothetical protein